MKIAIERLLSDVTLARYLVFLCFWLALIQPSVHYVALFAFAILNVMHERHIDQDAASRHLYAVKKSADEMEARLLVHEERLNLYQAKSEELTKFMSTAQIAQAFKR